MKKILLLIAVITSLVGCKQEEKMKERTLSDFFDEQEEIVLRSQTSDVKTRLLLDFYVGMTRKQFDSITQISISKNLMQVKNDTVFNLILPSVKNNNSKDYFDLLPVFRNDSLMAINNYITLGYYSYDSESVRFKEYTSILTNKYGGPKAVYSDHKPFDSENRMSRFKYHFWLKNNLFVEIHQSSFPDKEKNKEKRLFTIYYGSLEYMKDRIKITRKKEEMKSIQEKGEENRKKYLKTSNDSLLKEIF